MENKEKLLEKLRQIHMEQTIKLKNENIDKEDVCIEDVIYCGQIELEANGEKQKKDVFLVVKNIEGNIKMEYHTDEGLIAIDYNEMIIPLEEYQYNNFKEITDEKNRVSLNGLEQERTKNISKAIGVDEKEIQASSEIDSKKLNEEELLKKYVNIKSEFGANQRITSTENFENIVPGANKYNKIAVIYSDKTNDKFMLVGITSDGKVEKLEGLERTEGITPNENVVSSNRDGEEIQQKTVSSMFRIKSRPNEGFAMNIGNAGCVEVNYVRRSDEDDYISIPIESTHTRYVDSEVKDLADKTRNTYVDDNIKRAESEIVAHEGKANVKNIDDNPYNNIDHDNIIYTNNGEEKTYEEIIERIEKEQRVSRKEAERLFKENYNEGETVEKVLDDVDEEIADQLRINRR